MNSILPSTELITDAPSPLLLRQRELGCKNFNQAKWRRCIEEHRLNSLRIVGVLPVVFSHRAAATALDVDKNESAFLLAGSSKGSVDILNLHYAHLRPHDDTSAIVARHHHRRMVNCLQWYSEDISMFISASQDGTVKIWDVNRQEPFENYDIENPKQMHWNEVDRKNPLVAVSDTSSNVILIDFRKGNSAHNVRNKTPVSALRWFPSERILCTADINGCVNYYDIRNSMKPLRKVEIAKGREISAIRFTSDGRHLVCVDACQLQVFVLDALSFELIAACKATDEKVERIHPNSRNICLVEEGKQLRIAVPSVQEKIAWISVDTEKHEVTSQLFMSGHLNTVSSCAYREGSQQLITASVGMVVNWSSEGERARTSLDMESSYRQAREDQWSDSE